MKKRKLDTKQIKGLIERVARARCCKVCSKMFYGHSHLWLDNSTYMFNNEIMHTIGPKGGTMTLCGIHTKSEKSTRKARQ